ncbi:MAG: Crp/Fnr family transcriptional regulator [Planctomycetaceae bacterium]
MPHLERVTLSRDALLAEPGASVEYAYFPVGCVLSLIVVLDNGVSVEAGTAGNEGMVYIGVFAGQSTSPFRIVPQSPGDCLRIPQSALEKALDAIPRLRVVLQRYCLVLLLQSTQNAACNLRHSTEQRLARWLLVSADRAAGSQLALTQDSLSVLLGVRRQSINIAIGTLHRAGLISYRRGSISIVDRAGLEAVACECYRTNAKTFDRVMELDCADGVRVV